MNGLGTADLLALFGHFAVLSLLSVGGAIATAPEMHRLLVEGRHWLDDATFAGSVALAQAAPGPNVLFVAVLGWNVAGTAGVVAALSGSLLPSATLALVASRWGRARPHSRALRAFSTGMAPITIGLVLSTGWLLAEPARHDFGAALLVVGTLALMLGTRLSPVWAVACGAVAGALGWVG